MQNQEIIQIIENLKGRREYEEKKALKLGFTSLYSYFEDKLFKQEEIMEVEKKEIEFYTTLSVSWLYLFFCN